MAIASSHVMTESHDSTTQEPEQSAIVLTDADRIRIRLEEHYRTEVRNQLQVQDRQLTRGRRLLAFFGTNLGLWLLSAIFISGLGTLYRYYENQQEYERRRADALAEEKRIRLAKALDEERSRAATAERLDREISYRFSQSLAALDQLDIAWNMKVERGGKLVPALNEQDQMDNMTDSFRVVARLAQPPSDTPHGLLSLYPEFTTYDFQVLIAELERNVPAQKRTKLDEVRDNVNAVTQEYHGPPDQSPARLIAERLFRKCILSRWRISSFRYMVCTPERPFCQRRLDDD